MKITHDQYSRIKNLALHRFRIIFGHRLASPGYYNANRDCDESIVKALIWYYRYFRKALWRYRV